MCPTQTRYSNSNSEWDSGCAYNAPQCTLATRRFVSGSFRFHSLSLFLKPHPYKPSPFAHSLSFALSQRALFSLFACPIRPSSD